MNDHCSWQQIDIASPGMTSDLELSDFDADQQLLSLPGTSLVIFTSQGCAACRYARERLPRLSLPVERLAWIDAGANGGLVRRYEVFHLPALFVVRDGQFLGALHSRLAPLDLERALASVLARPPEELP
ncbi:thioredoxin family protein [Phytopseudomonas daroniae]|uniref:thioredoxin family protein n=1 Tax=Phytopseudomonas daroniae TaxID=2487519 RepID=UPI00103831D7|nr:thioredoxin family protein [Pseudomonas daroniae]TBU74175.1 thioredoxin [Pseudomonas daroniae]